MEEGHQYGILSHILLVTNSDATLRKYQNTLNFLFNIIISWVIFKESFYIVHVFQIFSSSHIHSCQTLISNFTVCLKEKKKYEKCTFALKCVPGKITDFSNADVTADEYHKYEVSNVWILIICPLFYFFFQFKACLIVHIVYCLQCVCQNATLSWKLILDDLESHCAVLLSWKLSDFESLHC